MSSPRTGRGCQISKDWHKTAPKSAPRAKALAGPLQADRETAAKMAEAATRFKSGRSRCGAGDPARRRHRARPRGRPLDLLTRRRCRP